MRILKSVVAPAKLGSAVDKALHPTLMQSGDPGAMVTNLSLMTYHGLGFSAYEQ